ncbi:MAG: MFS transporter [Chlamydiia bacterium]|nr:MFS transporter [Chlamydiia bacterium]
MTTPIEPDSSLYRLAVKRPSLLTLIVLISFGSIGAVVVTPAIPAIMDHFHVGASVAQLIVMLFLVGYSLGQLIYSPVAKRYGRKPALFLGLTLSLLGNILCILSAPFNSLFLLVVARFITALGASVGLSLTFMIISDYFYEKHARKVTAYTMLSFAVVPGVGTAIGGFLVTYLGWESSFYFLVLYGFFALYLVYRLAETSTEKEVEATKFTRIISAYLRDLKNPILTLHSIIIGSTTAFIYIFAATAPVIVIRIMGLSPDQFGLLNLIPAAGFFSGNFVSARLSHHLEIKTVLRLGITLIGVGVALFALLFLGGWHTPLTLFLPMFVLYFGIPLFYSNAAVIATFRVKDKLNASSIMSFLNIGGAVIGLSIIELFHSNPLYVLPSVFIFIYLVILLLFRKGQKLIS